MRERVLAKRYGRALFDLALESGKLTELSGDFKLLKSAAMAIPYLIKALSDERIDVKKRIGAVIAVASAMKLGTLSQSALKLLVAKGRISIFDLIFEDFKKRVERHEKLAVVKADAASGELTAELGKRIEEIIERELKIKGRCDVEVDPSLIGGFAAWLGDVRYDASIKGKLERMREELL